MKMSNAVILDLSSLPEQARQEVTDFYLFLKKNIVCMQPTEGM